MDLSPPAINKKFLEMTFKQKIISSISLSFFIKMPFSKFQNIIYRSSEALIRVFISEKHISVIFDS